MNYITFLLLIKANYLITDINFKRLEKLSVNPPYMFKYYDALAIKYIHVKLAFTILSHRFLRLLVENVTGFCVDSKKCVRNLPAYASLPN